MPSPICEVRENVGPYEATTFGVDVLAGSTITIRLADQSDVDSWSIECVTTDELNVPATINAALVIDSATKTATFEAPNQLGTALRFRSVVNNGIDANGTPNDEYDATFCIYILTALGARVIAADETTESHPDHGWIKSVNELIRNPSGVTSGEANTGSNLGAGAGVFKDKVGTVLRFRTLAEGANIALTPTADEVEVAVTGTVPLAENVTGVVAQNNGGTGLNTADLVAEQGKVFMVHPDAPVMIPVPRLSLLTEFNPTAPGQVIHYNGTWMEWAEPPPQELGHVGHRLTLTSNTPVTTSDVVGASTVYFTAYHSNRIALWDTTVFLLSARWKFFAFDQVSLALSGLTSNANYDVFAYWSGSAVVLELSAPWTNATTRADALARQDGVFVKASDIRRRYVGTIRTTATNTTEDSASKRFVWNYYNRVERFLRVTEAMTSWTYVNPNSVYRQVRNSSANRFEYVSGDVELLEVTASALGLSSSGVSNIAAGVGIDSTTVNSAIVYGADTDTTKSHGGTSLYKGYPAVGYHAINWLETGNAAAATLTFVGLSGTRQHGMVGSIRG